MYNDMFYLLTIKTPVIINTLVHFNEGLMNNKRMNK